MSVGVAFVAREGSAALPLFSSGPLLGSPHIGDIALHQHYYELNGGAIRLITQLLLAAALH
jgi:hypothetical protein